MECPMKDLSSNSVWLFPAQICMHCRQDIPSYSPVFMANNKSYCSVSCRRMQNQEPYKILPDTKKC